VADEGGPITSRNVIAVEGDDEKHFFGKLLRHIEVGSFDIRCVGGKNQFKNKLPALVKTSGFFRADGSPSIEHLAIVRDKDQDDAFKSIANIVAKAGLTPPDKHGGFSKAKPKVGIFIMPGDTVDGTMLEDLCLRTVDGHRAMDCVREFASCVAELPDPPKNMSKARVQAFKAYLFLAAQSEVADCVGLGAQRDYWNLDSPVLSELKDFLLQMK
jgi:hypothetical protein